MEDGATPQITNEEEKPKVEEPFEQMRVSTKKAPIRKKVDIVALKDSGNKPQYKVFKLKTKEGSIEEGVKLDEGTIVVKKIKGVGVVLEKEDKLYEMVTKDGASILVEGSKLFSYEFEGNPILLVPQGGKTHYFSIDKSSEKTTTNHFWYSRYYSQVYDISPTLTELNNENLLEFFINVPVQRPSLVPIEAAEDSKIYDLIPSEKVFLGSQDAATNDEGLDAAGIKHILCVATGMAYHKNLDKYTYKTIEIIDTPESQITDYFDECFDYIDNSIANFGGCLIHCNAGVSRSATICIAYIMKLKRITYQQSYEIVKSVKKDIKPNEGFVKQLLIYESTLNI